MVRLSCELGPGKAMGSALRPPVGNLSQPSLRQAVTGGVLEHHQHWMSLQLIYPLWYGDPKSILILPLARLLATT